MPRSSYLPKSFTARDLSSPITSAAQNMSESASLKETTRHIVVHRRRTPYRRFKHFVKRSLLITTASFLITSIFVDTLHPRTLTSESVDQLAQLLRNASTPSPTASILEKATIPSRYRVDLRTTHITANPPTLVSRHLLYWTPVESLTILTYPASPPLLHHASSVVLHLLPLSPVSITLLSSLPSQSTSSISRFTPFLVHPDKPAVILEHADGFLPARYLQTALYSAFVTLHPRALWDTSCHTSALLLSYIRRCIPQISVPEPLGWARRISNVVRERRVRNSKTPGGAR